MNVNVTIAYKWGEGRLQTHSHTQPITDDLPDDVIGEAVGTALRVINEKTDHHLKATAHTIVVSFTEN